MVAPALNSLVAPRGPADYYYYYYYYYHFVVVIIITIIIIITITITMARSSMCEISGWGVGGRG